MMLEEQTNLQVFPSSESRYLVNRLHHLGKEAYYREWISIGGHN